MVPQTERRTFCYFCAFDGLVVDSSSALFEELVALDTEIENLGTLDRQLDELLDNIVHNVRRGLR